MVPSRLLVSGEAHALGVTYYVHSLCLETKVRAVDGPHDNPLFSSSCLKMLSCGRERVRHAARMLVCDRTGGLDSGGDDGHPGRIGTWILALLLVVPMAFAVACFWRYHLDMADPSTAIGLFAWLDKPSPKRTSASPAASAVTSDKKKVIICYLVGTHR